MSSSPVCVCARVFSLQCRVGGCRETPMCALNRCRPNSCPPTLSLSQLFTHQPTITNSRNTKQLSIFSYSTQLWNQLYCWQRGQGRFVLDREDAISSTNLWLIQCIAVRLPHHTSSPSLFRFRCLCLCHSLSSTLSTLPLGPAAFSLIHLRLLHSGPGPTQQLW